MNEKTIYALGFFDGVHLGHGSLLKACRELADANSCKAAAVTFASHPDTLVLGKTPGKDEKSGKSTFVSLLGIEGAEAYTRGLCEKAKEILSLFPEGEARESLSAFCDFIISRNY